MIGIQMNGLSTYATNISVSLSFALLSFVYKEYKYERSYKYVLRELQRDPSIFLCLNTN